MKCGLRLLTLVLLGTLGLFLACAETTRRITVCHDPSLSAFIEAAGERFQSNHPGVRLEVRSQGSLQALREKASPPCDLMAVADWRLIERFLIPEQAEAGTIFLGDEMVLATADASLLDSDEKQKRWKENWPRLLFSQERSYGIVDPDRSPTGYFAQLTWKLAEIHYRNPGLYRRFLQHFTQERRFADWPALAQALRAQRVDFAFVFQSAAAQEGWEYVRFPAPVSLGESSQSDSYRQVFLEVEGSSPGQTLKMDGAPVRYGLCRLRDAAPEADRLMEYLLSPEAADLAKRLGYASVPQQTIGGRESR